MWKMKGMHADDALFTLVGERLFGAERLVSAFAGWLVQRDSIEDGELVPERAHLIRLKPLGASSAGFGRLAHILVSGRVETIPAQPRVADVDSDDMVADMGEGSSLLGGFAQTFVLLQTPDGRWLISQSILRQLEAP